MTIGKSFPGQTTTYNETVPSGIVNPTFQPPVVSVSAKTPALAKTAATPETPKYGGTETKNALSTGLQVAGIVTGGVTSILGLAYDFWQYNDEKKAAEKEAKRLQAIEKQAREEEQRRYNTDLSMARSATYKADQRYTAESAEEKKRYSASTAEEQKRYDTGLSMNKEQTQYDRNTQFMSDWLGKLARKPELEKGLMARFQRRS